MKIIRNFVIGILLLFGLNYCSTNASENGIELRDRPAYLKEYLEEVIRFDVDMKGFTSLRALYLYEKAIF